MTPYIIRRLALATALTAGIAACGKDTKTEAPANTSTAEKKGETGGAGKVIVVETYSDANGNVFKPAEVVAHKGDIIRFTNVSGAHNVHFLPDSNPGKAGLPPASDVLQIPGQTYELRVTLASGKYFFQCDPHAALGMMGHLKVED